MNEEQSDTTLRDLAKGWDTPKVSNSETPVVEPKEDLEKGLIEEFSPWKKTTEEEPKGTWVWIPENSASWLETMVSKLVESKLEEAKGNNAFQIPDDDDINQVATNAIDNYDFKSVIDHAVDEYDFSDALENDLQQVKDDLKSELTDQIREEVEECLSNATISI